jgi:hypothetical protein
MGIPISDFERMKSRVEKTHVEPELESVLHQQIIDWCNSFWPRLKYIHSRMDKATRNEKGVCDFVIFMPDKMVLCLEAKKKGCKPSIDQRNWHKELEMLCHKVFVVTNMDEVKQAHQDTICQRHDDEFFRNNNL